jgi:hypothetical protein
MKVVALFPWLQLDEEIDCGDFSLIPYVRGEAPDGAGTQLQATLDELTLPYRLHSNKPIKAATLSLQIQRSRLSVPLLYPAHSHDKALVHLSRITAG